MGVSETPCTELRLFHATWDKTLVVPAQQYSKTLGGWYDSHEDLARETATIRYVSAYVVANPVNPALLARSYGKLSKLPKGGGTCDDDVVSLSWLYIDIDSVRPSDVSATEEELYIALARQRLILDDVDGLRASSMWGCSGNGGWILTRLPDHPNDDAHRELIAQSLIRLSAKYSDNRATVDVKTKNPSRVLCLPGVLKCKGSDIPDRPYRLVTLDGIGWEDGAKPEPFGLKAWLEGQGGLIAVPAPAPPAASAAQRRRAYGFTRDQIVERARAYLFHYDPAVSGNHGHDQTFDAAQALVIQFDLSIAEARPLLKEWSLRCEPPWSDGEIEHKLDDADKLPDARGSKINENAAEWRAELAAERLNQMGKPPVDEETYEPNVPDGQGDNSHRLARLFLHNNQTADGKRTFYCWNDDFWSWDGVYNVVSIGEMRSKINGFLAAEFQRLYEKELMEFGIAGESDGTPGKKPPRLINVTTRMVSDVIQAISARSLLTVNKIAAQPEWVSGEHAHPANEYFAGEEGVIHLRSWADGDETIIPPTPEYFSTNRVRYSFRRSGRQATNWLTLLGAIPVTSSSAVRYQIWPNEPRCILTLQEWFGLHLVADTSYQKILTLLGPRRSGKGTIASVLMEMVGYDNVAGPTLKDLGERFGLESLIGKRAAIVDDVRIDHNTDMATIAERMLSISGQGLLSVPRRYKGDWIGKISAKLTMMSNVVPRLSDQSSALPGRLLILPMTHSFYGQEDNKLLEKILPEMPEIFNWAVEGWKRLEERGRFSQPEEAKDIMEELETLSSPMTRFLEDCCTIGPDYEVRCDVFYAAWCDWCKDHGRKEPGESAIVGRNLRSQIPGIKTKQGTDGDHRFRKYVGVRFGKLANPAAQQGRAATDDAFGDDEVQRRAWASGEYD